MTESGQEPPGIGRRTADASGKNGTRSEFSGPNRRRRKRRSGQGPKGGAATEQRSAASSGDKADVGQLRHDSGHVEHTQSTQDGAPPVERDGAKRRKKRRRGRSDTDGRNAAHAAGPADQAQSIDSVTSPKGKKAANRRGRRRWQASRNAKNGRDPKPDAIAGQASINAEPANGHSSPPLKDDSKAQEARGHRSPSSAQQARTNADRGPRGRRSRNNGARAPLYAALDLGTNNCRLLIARPEERGFRVVDAYSRIVRLGEGVGSNKRLSSAAMDRAIDALDNCHRKLADRGVLRSRLIATEACRAAENGAAFIERVKSETGLALEVVNRETEARLAVAGCASLVDHQADGVILFDIGGGSSEIVWLDLRNRCGARGYALTRFIRSWISLPVGVVNLAERHGGVHVTPDIFEAMVDDAADHLSAFSLADTLSEAIGTGRVHMLGTSGTVTTLAGVHLGLPRYDRRKVDGTWLDDDDVARMIDQLRDMPYEARVENPCIGADRADLVLAGCAILEAIRRRWSCSRLRVADRGLREGILTELMAADGVWSHRSQRKRQDRRRWKD
ncbi:exopolyphosphatase [Roseibium sp.]|uniref:Ppx/GppA phosphatase family protein n=1 Tax=Roseibium sp. TaxID=1936156 RepID=UPI003B5152EC